MKKAFDYVKWAGLLFALIGSAIIYASTIRVNCAMINNNKEAILKNEKRIENTEKDLKDIKRATDRLEILLDVLKIPKKE